MKTTTTNFKKFIVKNTTILHNPSRNGQLTFWLKKLPSIGGFDVKEFFEKLFMEFTSCFFFYKNIENLGTIFSRNPLKDFKHIHITILTLFELKDKKSYSELFDAKIHLGTEEEILNSWGKLLGEMTKIINKKYKFCEITSFLTFKIVIIYSPDSIENQFISGKLIESFLDVHHNIIYFKHKKF